MSLAELPLRAADAQGGNVKQEGQSGGKALKKPSPGRVLDLLPRAIEAVRWGSTDRFNEVIECMAKEVDGARPALAEKIRRAGGLRDLKPLTQFRPGSELVRMVEATRTLDSIVVRPELREQVSKFVAEAGQREALARYRLKPRHKVFLSGPPGNGKTLLAQAVSNALGVPFLNVRYGALIDSHLGESGKNIDKLLDYAESGPCVLFFDEFDGVAVKRSDGRDITEIRRVTNHLLIRLEQIPETVNVIAATNEVELIDHAILRRFDTHWTVPAPTPDQKLACISAELDPAITDGCDLRHLYDRIVALPIANFSGLVDLCMEIRRDVALNAGADIERILDARRAQTSLGRVAA